MSGSLFGYVNHRPLLHSSWNYNTPPDSPRCYTHGQYNDIIPEIDIYAIPSLEGELPVHLGRGLSGNNSTNRVSCVVAENQEIYFIAIIDVLTHYGVKKQVSRATGGPVDRSAN